MRIAPRIARARLGPGTMGRRLLAVFLLSLALGASGCPRKLPEFGPAPFEEAEAVLAAVHARQLAPDSFIADARVRLVGPRMRGSADHFVVVRAPEDLRFETLSFFGNPLALVMVTEGTFLLWEIDASRAWEGPATAESLAALLPIDLGPREVIALLRGKPMLYEEDKRLDLDHENRRYVVSLRHGRLWQQLVVHPEDFTIEESRWFDAAGELRATLRYSRYREVGEGVFPYEVGYETADGVSLRVLYRDVELEPEQERLDMLFGTKLPDHVEVLPLDPGAPPAPVIPESEAD